MKRLFLLLACLAVAGGRSRAGEQPATCFVQLVKGTNKDREHATWKEVGPKLQKQLSPIFQWKNYFEVSRTKINVAPGKSSRVRLTSARELEVALDARGGLLLRLFRGGKPARTMKDSVSRRRMIMGGESDGREAWFIVLLRDEPSPK